MISLPGISPFPNHVPDTYYAAGSVPGVGEGHRKDKVPVLKEFSLAGKQT